MTPHEQAVVHHGEALKALDEIVYPLALGALAHAVLAVSARIEELTYWVAQMAETEVDGPDPADRLPERE